MSQLRLLAEQLHQFSGIHVLCAGDLMLDRYVYGQVSRTSPEAPIPVVEIDREVRMLGGAGNAVRNLCALGASVRFFAVVGADEESCEIEQSLAGLPGCRAYLQRDQGRRTSVKTRYVARGQQLLRVDSETVEPVPPKVLDQLLLEFVEALPWCDVVLLSDYAKGLLNGEYAQRFVQQAQDAGKPVLVDPKGRDFRRYRGATLIKPNLQELSLAMGQSGWSDQSIELASHWLIRNCGISSVLVTRGAEGMTLVTHGSPGVSFPSAASEVYDVSGAGDTVAATLALAIGAGIDLEHGVALANFAAGVVVAKAGTAVVPLSELRQKLHQEFPNGRDAEGFV